LHTARAGWLGFFSRTKHYSAKLMSMWECFHGQKKQRGFMAAFFKFNFLGLLLTLELAHLHSWRQSYRWQDHRYSK